MDDVDLVLNVSFSVSTRLVPWDDPDDYVQSIFGRAVDTNEEQQGTISLELVSSTEAANKHQQLFFVCEAHSSMLEAIFSTLFDTNGDPQDELDITPGWSQLLFIDEVFTKAGYENTPLRVRLIETSIALFCANGLVVADEDSLGLTVDDWRELGFKRIAGSSFVFRDQQRLNPYEHPTVADPGEASYVCDSCGEQIVIPLDLSEGASQKYVEDCPVCCRANVIHVEFDEFGNVTVWAEPEQDHD